MQGTLLTIAWLKSFLDIKMKSLPVRGQISLKKINPIKNVALHLHQNNLRSHIIKRQKGRTWEFDAGERFKDETLKNVLCALKTQKNVQTRSLRMANLGVLQEDGVRKAKKVKRVFKVLRKDVSLKDLSVEFWGRGTQDYWFHELRGSIQNMKFLNNLSIDFSGHFRITEDGAEHLAKGLRTLTSLKRLSTNMNQ